MACKLLSKREAKSEERPNGSPEDLLAMVPLFPVATSIAVERITGKNQYFDND
ncbi:hypothetical protein IIA28_07315 [candidate division KSB1 bacterium]|nr:hypothetical protein [candidate division KSB1 bacterium]